MSDKVEGVSKRQAIEILKGIINVLRECGGVKEVIMPTESYKLLEDDSVSKDKIVEIMKRILDKL